MDCSNLVGIVTYKTFWTYVSILAILKSGRGYVPINAKFSAERKQQIIALSGLNTVIAGDASGKILVEIAAESPINLIFPSVDCINIDADLQKTKRAAIFTNKDLYDEHPTDYVASSDVAYLLFTSGSTGVPKGVAIKHLNVISYIENINKLFDFEESDRFSQLFELTFDLSIHDIFVCFSKGATLCIPPELLSPVSYANKHKITVWFSVPSLASLVTKSVRSEMMNLKTLRHSLFCGEPLPLSVATKWKAIAPKSQIHNIYGPTEATIGITIYTCPDQNIKSNFGFVSIGKVFSDQRYTIINDELGVQKYNTVGELCLAGSQVISRYWTEELSANKKFLNLDQSDEHLWYRTGDLVIQDEDNDVFYIARKDFQVKVRGYRVELQEIDFVIKAFVNHDNVVSVAVTNDQLITEGIYTFIEGAEIVSKHIIIDHCSTKLAHYMVPENIIYVNTFPLNLNGKVDRNALLDLI